MYQKYIYKLKIETPFQVYSFFMFSLLQFSSQSCFRFIFTKNLYLVIDSAIKVINEAFNFKIYQKNKLNEIEVLNTGCIIRMWVSYLAHYPVRQSHLCTT